MEMRFFIHEKSDGLDSLFEMTLSKVLGEDTVEMDMYPLVI